VRKPLDTLTSGKPQLQVSPRCETLCNGFLGRYQYRRVRVRGSAERYHDVPEKDVYSRPHDALQCVATKGAALVINLRTLLAVSGPPRSDTKR
jgi:hypothetical protein